MATSPGNEGKTPQDAETRTSLEPLHLHPIHAHVLPRITIFVEDLQRATRTFLRGLDLRFQGFSFTSEVLF